jgi:hypothetical protein
MDPQVESLLAELDRGGEGDAPQRGAARQRSAWLAQASDRQLEELAEALLTRPPPGDAVGELLSAGLTRLGRGASRQQQHPLAKLPPPLARHLAALYGYWRSSGVARQHLLRLLAERGDDAALALLAECLAEDPPRRDIDVAEVLAPLFRRRDYDPAAIFPRLLDSLAHTSVATSALDLANFLVRERRVSRHPGAERRERLELLLGEFVQRLASLEERPLPRRADAQDGRQTVDQSVSLVVSLCDALALIGETSAAGKLFQALELRHRRIRTEAAAALARLGEPAGVQALIELAAEPVARLRVLAYADELGLREQVPLQFSTELAQAEAELALWLAQPAQFGLPPTRIELLDQRAQAWPGFDDPVVCFLLRYHYELGDYRFSNVAITGPLTCTFASDLNSLSIDDLYALFAGWQADHPEIYRLPCDALQGADQLAAQRLARFLEEAGYRHIRPAWLGVFFGQQSLVAEAALADRKGVAIADQDQIFWRPIDDGPRPLGVEELYDLYKGRMLLEAFKGEHH